MTAAFGHKFTKTYGTEDTGVWYEALSDLTQKAVEKGFKKMLHDVENIKPGQDVWPPNVKEFRAYCLLHQEAFGLPTIQNAFLQVMDAKYMENMYVDHPVVYYAALLVGYEKLTQVEAEKFYSEYQCVYELFSAAIINGLSFPCGTVFAWNAEKSQFALRAMTAETIQKAIINLAQRLTIRKSQHV